MEKDYLCLKSSLASAFHSWEITSRHLNVLAEMRDWLEPSGHMGEWLQTKESSQGTQDQWYQLS